MLWTKNLNPHIAFIGRLLRRKLEDKAKEFSEGFKKLHDKLHQRTAAQNLVVTLGIQQKVDELSMYFGIYTYLRAQNRLHSYAEYSS